MLTIKPIDWDRIERMHTLRGRKLPAALWAIVVILYYGWRNIFLGIACSMVGVAAIINPSLPAITGAIIIVILLADFVIRSMKVANEWGRDARSE